jgi:hypothetical protein
MPPTIGSPPKLCVALAATTLTLGAAGSASSADQGSVEIVAIAPAVCRITAPPPASSGRLCNTASGVQVSVQVSNLNGAALQLDGADIAVSASGAATLSPAQLAGLSGLRLADGARGDLGPPVAVELTVTPQ